MRIVQTVFGVFHHFHLARELERRGHLQQVYSTWPWARLRREGLPHRLVETYPWFHMAEYAVNRSPVNLRWLSDDLGYANALNFDQWTEKKLRRSKQKPDALIGISGSSLSTGSWLQREGGIFVCDRGSTHQRFQQQLVEEEFALWGVDRPVSDPRDTAREEAIYAQADAITVGSSFGVRSFTAMGVPAEKIHRIPYGVELPPTVLLAEPAEDEFHVLFAGGAGLRKGVPYLLQAFSLLAHPHKTLHIAGYVRPDLRDILHRLPTDHVHFHGPVPRQQLYELMSRSDALVLPSIEDGFGMVMAEAMAHGCPVISSTNTGGPDLYDNEKEGFIVPIRDAGAIVDRLQWLADNPTRAMEMRLAARQRVATLSGWSDYGGQWEKLLFQLTGENA